MQNLNTQRQAIQLREQLISEPDSLLHCPFCGSLDVSVIDGDSPAYMVAVCNCCHARGPRIAVQKAGLSINRGKWENRAVAVAKRKWNERRNNLNQSAHGRPYTRTAAYMPMKI